MHGNRRLLQRVMNYLSLGGNTGFADECRAGPITECNVTDIAVDAHPPATKRPPGSGTMKFVLNGIVGMMPRKLS